MGGEMKCDLKAAECDDGMKWICKADSNAKLLMDCMADAANGCTLSVCISPPRDDKDDDESCPSKDGGEKKQEDKKVECYPKSFFDHMMALQPNCHYHTFKHKEGCQ